MIAKRSSFRTMSNPEQAYLLDEYANAIERAVDFGGHLLEALPQTLKRGDVDIPIEMSLRHFLDLLDAISVLVRQSSIDPCKLLLRGMLESYFGLAYILEDATKQPQRSTAFLVYHTHKRIKQHQLGNPSSEERRQFEASLKLDTILSDLPVPVDAEAELRVNRLRLMLQKDVYKAAEADFQAKKPKNWFTMFGGPVSVEALARHLKMTAFYELFYRSWSSATHGIDILVGKMARIEGQEGLAGILQLRRPNDTNQVVYNALMLTLRTFRLIVEQLIPALAEELSDFYVTEIREAFWKALGSQPPSLLGIS